MIDPGLSFEQVRDLCFVDPRSRNPGILPEAARFLAESLLGADTTLEIGDPSSDNLLYQHIASLAEEMKGARRFDHHSVAQLHPADNIPGIAGNFASTLMNNNTIVGDVSPVESRLEKEVIEWLRTDIAGYDPTTSSGALGAGGSLANLSAMYVAREDLIRGRGWKGRTNAYVFTNEMAHYSIKKAADILAPNQQIKVVTVPFRSDSLVMDKDRLAEMVMQYKGRGKAIMAIVGLAGETETGLVEDLDGIADIAKSNDIFFHVDGAYGAPFRLSRARPLFDGISEADSITCDPHKYLYTPYSAGAILFKDQQKHARIARLNVDGEEYLFKSAEERDAHSDKAEAHTHLGRMRIEGSMGGQAAASLMMTIRAMGSSGIGKLLDHTLDVTDEFHHAINATGTLKTLFDHDLNTLCVIPNVGVDCYPEAMQSLMEPAIAELEDKTGIYITTTTLPIAQPNGIRKARKVFRIVPTHPHTTTDDAREITDQLAQVWKSKIS
jgi:aromatic-L-amino-acid decarboxylase